METTKTEQFPFEIQIQSLRTGNQHVSLEAPASFLEMDQRFPGAVRAEVNVERLQGGITLHVALETMMASTCDRCLSDISLKISTSFNLLYIIRRHEPDDQQNEESDTYSISPETPSINFSDDARQYLMLAVPPKILCSESCKGLCPTCGTNLNVESCECSGERVDPRWEPLRELRKHI